MWGDGGGGGGGGGLVSGAHERWSGEIKPKVLRVSVPENKTQSAKGNSSGKYSYKYNSMC